VRGRERERERERAIEREREREREREGAGDSPPSRTHPRRCRPHPVVDRDSPRVFYRNRLTATLITTQARLERLDPL